LLNKFKHKLKGDIHLKDLLKGSAITFLLKMGGMGLSYVLVYLISQKLGAEGVGFYQVMVQIITVLGMILGLGMNTSVLRYVGQFNNDEERPKMHLLYSYFVKLVVPLTLIISVILYVSAEHIVILLGKEALYAEGLRMVAIAMPFFTINQISLEFIRGLSKLQISELVRSVLRPLVMVTGISLFFWEDIEKMDVIYLLVASVVINSMVSRWSIWKALKKVPKTPSFFKRKDFIKTSMPMMITGISSALLVAMPIFFLDYYASQRDAGIFSVAFRLASLVSLVLVVVNTIAAPKFAELYWTDKKIELQKFINQSVKIIFWVSFFLTIIIISSGNFLLSLFGDEFIAGYWVLVILVIGQLVNAATGSVGIFMNMSGKQKAYRNINLIALGVTISLLVAFRNYLTLELVSLIMLVKVGMLNLCSLIYIKKKIKLITYINF
jgi:O-antigen/teichoic acid export membrane protein